MQGYKPPVRVLPSLRRATAAPGVRTQGGVVDKKPQVTEKAAAPVNFAELVEMFNKLPQALADIEKIKNELLAAHAETLTKAQGVQISFEAVKRGAPGVPGKTPDIDYQRIVDEVKKYIPTPKDGETPVVDHKKIARMAAKLVEVPLAKDGKDADEEGMLGRLVDRLEDGSVVIPLKTVDGLDRKFAEVNSRIPMQVEQYGKNTWKRGGGDTVAAGSNVTITTNGSGQKVINASGGGGGGGGSQYFFAQGVTDGVNQDFTYTGTLEAVLLNGQYQTLGIDYTLSGNVIMFTYAPAPGTYVEVLVTGSVNGQTPVGVIDGSNATFTVMGVIDTLFLNGTKQIVGVDYTLSGQTITFTYPPSVGSILYVLYAQGAIITPQTVSGTINGVNTIFTVAATFNMLFLAGAFQTPNIDYTLLGLTITFTYPPTIGPLKTL